MQTLVKGIIFTLIVLSISTIAWQNTRHKSEEGLAKEQLNKGVKNATVFSTTPLNEDSSVHPHISNGALHAKKNKQKSATENDDFLQNMVNVNSIEELQEYFGSQKSDSNFSFVSVLDYVNSSEQALNYVSRLYLESEDLWLEQRAFDLLYKSLHPEKVAVISSMVNSSSPSIQAKGKKLLSSNIETTSQYEVLVGLIIDASYMTEDIEELQGLTSAFRYSERQEIANEFTKNIIFEHLQNLASDNRPELAAHALSTLMQVSQDETSLNIVKAHLAHGSTDIKLNALQSLKNVSYPSEDIMPTLNVMMNDSTLPREVRALAAKRLINFENQERKRPF